MASMGVGKEMVEKKLELTAVKDKFSGHDDNHSVVVGDVKDRSDDGFDFYSDSDGDEEQNL